MQPAFGQPSSVGLLARAPHPHAALLFADFILSPEGQEIIKSRNRVPTSRAVENLLGKFDYALIDPVVVLIHQGVTGSGLTAVRTGTTAAESAVPSLRKEMVAPAAGSPRSPALRYGKYHIR